MKTALVIIFLCGFSVFSAIVKNELRIGKSPLATLTVGQAMPNFTLRDPAGAETTLSKVTAEKKLVMINFWASWCAPCRLEMPGFEKLYTSKNKDGFVILAVNEDEERSKLDAYLKEKPLTFPVLLDPDSALMKQFGVRALPTTILVGGDGKILEVIEGVQEYLEYSVEANLKADPNKK